MLRNIPRLLTILAVAIVFSFVPSAFALGGLLGGLTETVEEVLQVDEADGQEEEVAVEEQVDDGSTGDESLDSETTVEGESDSVSTSDEGSDVVAVETEPVLQEPADDESVEVIGTTIEPETDAVAETDPYEQVVDAEPDSYIDVDDELLELDGNDKYVRVENELLESVADDAGVDTIGHLAYVVQEELVHGTVTKTTGIKVDHYYLWTCIGDVCLPVDPFRFSN